MKFIDRKLERRYCTFILATILLQACTKSYPYKEAAMPESIKFSPRLQSIFAKTKLVCFGRYAMEVPQEAELIIGMIGIPPIVEVVNGGIAARSLRIATDITKIKENDDTSEITYNEKGPVDASWQIRFYQSESAKKEGMLFIDTYVTKGDLTFYFGDAVGSKMDGNEDNEGAAGARAESIAKKLRLRDLGEVPSQAGFCISHAFVSNELYIGQEIANAGIYLPSFPDVTFSISSNKDAYGDYPPDEFEKTERAKLSLLARIGEAKKDQGGNYPKRTVLREGKRDVQHWHGEESLIKRANGVHDFEWALVGTPRDVANPSEFSAVMFTKVKHNTVGAASAASVSDDEAVALWDKLLSGLKFRVKVPGAPEGSYYFDGSKPAAPSQVAR